MCLRIESFEIGPFVAKEDIVCYKRVRKSISPLKFKNKYLHKEFNGIVDDIRYKGIVTSITPAEFYLGNTLLYFSKVTKIDDDEESVMNYFTPYQNVSVEIGKEYNGKLDPPYREIERGFHSYKYFSDCKQDQCYNEVIVRCIIPKGSKYYGGVFGLSPSYASNAIKYLKIIPLVQD